MYCVREFRTLEKSRPPPALRGGTIDHPSRWSFYLYGVREISRREKSRPASALRGGTKTDVQHPLYMVVSIQKRPPFSIYGVSKIGVLHVYAKNRRPGDYHNFSDGLFAHSDRVLSNDRKEPGLSIETVQFYKQKLKYFAKFCESQSVTQVGQLTPDMQRVTKGTIRTVFTSDISN